MMDVFVDTVVDTVTDIRTRVNFACSKLDAAQIILISFGATLVFSAVFRWIFDEHVLTPWQRLRNFVLSKIRALPPVRNRVQAEIKKSTEAVEDGFNKHMGSNPVRYVTQMPEKGKTAEEVIEATRLYKKLNTADWENGKVSGTVYGGDKALTDLMTTVFADFAWTNPLHPDIFIDVRRMEAEVVRICCSIFNGDASSCGTMTSGGTESIIMACRTYRDMAIERGIKFPEMVVPITAHAAFDKAAQYLRMKITHIPIDEQTRKVKVSAMKRAINRRTCMLVGSAPGFPHGIMDDIEAIQEVGLRYGIPVHVDACLGGFLLPFMERAGYPMPPGDFRLPGVTSISCDTHKYAFSPKGSSVILYRDNKYRMYQIFVAPNWPGGIYASPSMPGSRPGVIVAQSWASLQYYGMEGYVATTKEIVATARKISDGIRRQPYIKVYGDPLMNVVGVGSDDFDIFRLSDALSNRAWSLNSLQFPGSFHIAVTRLHTKPGVVERLLKDIEESVAEIMRNPESYRGGIAQVYGSSQSIPDRSLVGTIAANFIATLYSTRDPVRMDNGAPKSNGQGH